MISARGPKQILVVDSTGVPIRDVCEGVVSRQKLSDIRKRYMISNEEILAAIDSAIMQIGSLNDDFIEFNITRSENAILVEPSKITDCLFLALVSLGCDHCSDPNEDSIDILFSSGIAYVLFNYFSDLKKGLDYYLYCDIHRVVAQQFTAEYGVKLIDDLDLLLETFKGKLDE